MGVDDEDDENEEMPFTVHLAQLRNGQPVLQRIEKFEPFRGRKITVNQMGRITIIPAILDGARLPGETVSQ